MSSWRCSRCDNKGVFHAWMRPEACGNDKVPGPFIFKCGCGYGSTDKRAFPVWSNKDDKVFTIEVISGLPDGKASDVKTPPQAPETPRKPTVTPLEAPRANAHESFFDGVEDDDLF